MDIYEDQIKDRLINKVLSVSMIMIGIAYLLAQLRALDIGWAARDFFQTIIVFRKTHTNCLCGNAICRYY